ncbi:hypothetical protein [Peribacillus kribbensis]|uniref:hypothetical protein n=1 Tax=Peribacillus kribbensis TaxID=356658 RepID=UPI0004044381|nr:hypothetical protein [Peribacillus kribbensis]
MITRIKSMFKKRITSIFLLQILLTMVGITMLILGFRHDDNTIYIKIVFSISSITYFLAGLENLLLKSEKWAYCMDFLFGTLFLIYSLFILN